MSETPADWPGDEPVDERADADERRRRVAEVFGDVLPETTSDEREPDTGRHESSRDDWFRDQVPPHHG